MANATVNGAHARHDLNQLGMRLVTLSAGTETANVIPVTVQVVNTGGTSLSDSVRCIATVVGEAAAAFTLAETGDGAEVSITARPGLVFTTSAAGAATISVTDVAGASGATVTLAVQVVDELGLTSTVEVTFD